MINRNFGKINNGSIEYAKMPVVLNDDIVVDGVVHPAGSMFSTNLAAPIMQLGYLPVVTSERPTEEGYYFTEAWAVENGQIVQSWEQHEESATIADYRDALTMLGVNVDE